MAFAHPILSCEEALAFEDHLLGSEEEAWEAMTSAGTALGHRIFRDYNEVGPFPANPRILLLLGKGHNSGDACLSANVLLGHMPEAEVFIYTLSPEPDMRPLTRRAFNLIADRVRVAELEFVREETFDICLDGVFGMQFQPPLRDEARHLFQVVNANPYIHFRAAVDIPSGLGDGDAFRADLTYATGIAKQVVFNSEHAGKVGRLRYLDIGFFEEAEIVPSGQSLLTVDVLSGIRGLRHPLSDKRQHGHLFVLAGSRQMPGAMLMCAQAAATAGVGLLTVFAPESVYSYLISSLPEAMWVPVPETPQGTIALESRLEILSRMDKATALVIGPGIGKDEETARLIEDLVRTVPVPVLLDADALQSEIVQAAANREPTKGEVILTPHAGEYRRIGNGESPESFVSESGLTMVLKGPLTRVYAGDRCIYSPFGGPVLARGGTGDLLSGIIGARLAKPAAKAMRAACEGVAWHGRAADEWARARGSTGVRTTGLLDFLPEGLLHE